MLRGQRVFRYSVDDEHSETAQLEKAYREFTGCAYAHAVNSGTSALICALVGVGVGPGDEVIVPGYTYIATAAAVVAVGAVPVIGEVDESLTLDPEDVKKKISKYTKAILPVHMRGTPCQMDELMAIAKEHGLKVVEDTAQADGGMYKGKVLGGIGDAGFFSFQQSKTITAGEGGILVTNDKLVYDRAVMAHDSAFGFWKPDCGIKPIPGMGFRISEVSGAIALTQFGKLDSIVTRLHDVKYRIVEQCRDLPGITLQAVPDEPGDASVAFIVFADNAKDVAEALKAEGIGCGTIYDGTFPDRHIYQNWTYVLEKNGWSDKWNPWTNPPYEGDVEYSRDMCPNTLAHLNRAVHIGLSQKMTDQDADDIAAALKKVAEGLNG